MASNTPHRLLIMAGGTGGHVMPALAVAEKLIKKGIEIHWLGTKHGIEATLVGQANIPFHTIDVKPLRGKGLLGWLSAPFRISKAFVQAVIVLRKVKPHTVMSMGGYVSGPGGLAAWLLRVPLILHEQNAISGLTNKLLAPFAKKILTAFPKTFKSNKVSFTGNPVRDSIVAIGPTKKRYEQGPVKVLIIGGSLGARVLNQVVPKAIEGLYKDIHLEVWHQTGKADLLITKDAYREVDSRVRVEPFIENMASAYEWADLVIARAGALTIAELAAAGVPSILIPFPYAVDDHQSYNARYLTDAGAAILLPQSDLNSKKLIELITQLAVKQDSLKIMGEKGFSLAKPKATDLVANACIEVSSEASSAVQSKSL